MTTRQRGALTLSGGGALLAAALAVNSVLSGAPTLGHHLATAGYTAAASRAGQTMQETPFSPDAALDWANYGAGSNAAAWDASFFARYGMHTKATFGQPVRGIGCNPARDVSGDQLERIIRHSSNPFAIEEHATYGVTRTELEDLRWLTKPGAGCAGLAVDTLVWPTACSVGVLADGCPAPPEPTPTPTPGPTPLPPAYRWSATETECPDAETSLCLALRFFPSELSTGRLAVSVREVP